MSDTPAKQYEFGDFRLNLDESVLWKNNEIVRLTPKAIEVLKLLVHSEGRVLSRDEMIQTLWPNAPSEVHVSRLISE